jgi:hypothetical protein
LRPSGNFYNACGGIAKIPPEAVEQLSSGHRFRFSFLLYFVFAPHSRTASQGAREAKLWLKK